MINTFIILDTRNGISNQLSFTEFTGDSDIIMSSYRSIMLKEILKLMILLPQSIKLKRLSILAPMTVGTADNCQLIQSEELSVTYLTDLISNHNIVNPRNNTKLCYQIWDTFFINSLKKIHENVVLRNLADQPIIIVIITTDISLFGMQNSDNDFDQSHFQSKMLENPIFGELKELVGNELELRLTVVLVSDFLSKIGISHRHQYCDLQLYKLVTFLTSQGIKISYNLLNHHALYIQEEFRYYLSCQFRPIQAKLILPNIHNASGSILLQIIPHNVNSAYSVTAICDFESFDVVSLVHREKFNISLLDGCPFLIKPANTSKKSFIISNDEYYSNIAVFVSLNNLLNENDSVLILSNNIFTTDTTIESQLNKPKCFWVLIPSVKIKPIVENPSSSNENDYLLSQIDLQMTMFRISDRDTILIVNSYDDWPKTSEASSNGNLHIKNFQDMLEDADCFLNLTLSNVKCTNLNPLTLNAERLDYLINKSRHQAYGAAAALVSHGPSNNGCEAVTKRSIDFVSSQLDNKKISHESKYPKQRRLEAQQANAVKQVHTLFRPVNSDNASLARIHDQSVRFHTSNEMKLDVGNQIKGYEQTQLPLSSGRNTATTIQKKGGMRSLSKKKVPFKSAADILLQNLREDVDEDSDDIVDEDFVQDTRKKRLKR